MSSLEIKENLSAQRFWFWAASMAAFLCGAFVLSYGHPMLSRDFIMNLSLAILGDGGPPYTENIPLRLGNPYFAILLTAVTGFLLTWPLIFHRSIKITLIAALLVLTPAAVCLAGLYCVRAVDWGYLSHWFYSLIIIGLHVLRSFLRGESWFIGGVFGAIIIFIFYLEEIIGSNI